MRPVDRSSTAITRWSSARRRSARFEPMNPAPPVTRIVVTGPRVGWGPRRCPTRRGRPVRAARRPGTRPSRRCPCTARAAGRAPRAGRRAVGDQPLAQPGVRDDAAADQHALDARAPRRLDRLGHLHVDDRLLEARRKVGHVEVTARRALALDVPQHGGLQPAHREVEVAGVLHRAREPDRVRVAGAAPRRRAPARRGTRARASARPCRRPPPPRRRASGRAPRGGTARARGRASCGPPLTISATYGGSGFPCSRKFAQ